MKRPRKPMSVITLLRRAKTTGASRYSISGALKTRHKPRAISLAQVKCLMRDDGEEPK